MKQKKIPLRKCTGCQQMKDKRELIRVVKDLEGNFSIDLTGKKSGRGSYVCNNIECFERANKSRGFERSFKSPVPKDIYEQLRTEFIKNG